jgi:hypothetical protein
LAESTQQEDATRELEHFLVAFQQESDRAAVILGGVQLDEILLRILERVIPCPDKEDNLLVAGFAPLGDFASRALLIYRLGLIDKEFHEALRQMKKLRNDFAHNLRVSLEDQKCLGILGALKNLIGDSPRFPAFMTAFQKPGRSQASSTFRAVIVLLISQLLSVQAEAEIKTTQAARSIRSP